MSTKNNPGAFRCFEAALPDEHIFTILARDPAGPATLRYWASERKALGKTENTDDRDRIDDALRDALLMETWREENLDPLGDGGPPSWKLTKINDEMGGPIRQAKDPTVYVPAERDGTEAVRLNVEWLTARTRDLVEGRMSREEYTNLIELACQSPDRRKAADDFDYLGEFEHQKVYVTKACPSVIREQMTERLRTPLPDQTVAGDDDSLLLRLKGAIERLKDGRLPAPYDLYRAVAKQVQVQIMGEPTPSPWTYECIGIGLSDLEEALHRLRVPTEEKSPVAVPHLKPGERLVVDTDPDDLAHAPEVPPHRFSQFHKGEQYAYARGLEINPTHLPTALDAMAKDGWHLLAIFGQTDSQHVGFIFERGIPTGRLSGLEIAHGFGGPSREELERRREGPQYARFMSGEPLDEIRAEDPPVAERFVIEYAERVGEAECRVIRQPYSDWPEWAIGCGPEGMGRGMEP